MESLLSTAKKISRLLPGIYLVLILYCFVSYWFISRPPVLSPLIAGLHSFIGDINELPLGEAWTLRYTLRIIRSPNAGLCLKDCIIFPPFSLREGRFVEFEVRSILICPGYQPRIKILFNNTVVADHPISYEWQTIRCAVPHFNRLLPCTLKLWFDMALSSEVSKSAEEVILQAVPGDDALEVWESDRWLRQDTFIKIDDLKIRKMADKLLVNEKEFFLNDMPIILAITPWAKFLSNSQWKDLPVAACRSIRVVR
jgi:hypothetical protein